MTLETTEIPEIPVTTETRIEARGRTVELSTSMTDPWAGRTGRKAELETMTHTGGIDIETTRRHTMRDMTGLGPGRVSDMDAVVHVKSI